MSQLKPKENFRFYFRLKTCSVTTFSNYKTCKNLIGNRDVDSRIFLVTDEINFQLLFGHFLKNIAIRTALTDACALKPRFAYFVVIFSIQMCRLWFLIPLSVGGKRPFKLFDWFDVPPPD